MESLLNAVSFVFFKTGYHVNLSWFSQFVKLIIEGVGIVGVGVIVFTLILKAITTPFDVYQRIRMRKQNLIMRSMQDDLEKLKKQYANDKTMYNAKMMELQKKNGYGMLGMCLPMIVSLVILIYAVTCFQAYSQYANLSVYEGMSNSYNQAVMEYSIDGIDYRLDENSESDRPVLKSKESFTEDGITYTYFLDGNVERVKVESADEAKCIYYTYAIGETTVTRNYFIDVDRAYTNQSDSDIKAAIKSYIDEGKSTEDACLAYFKNIGAVSAAEFYRTSNNPGFLWIKNVWYPDVSYSHPIQDYETFKKSITKKIVLQDGSETTIGDILTTDEYNDLTAQLVEEKTQPNGYFILIILTIALMAVSQFITMRSQKESSQYQTLDGRGSKQQKIMLVVMLVVYAVFGFMWTSAFSIYVAVSSIFSIIVSLLTNLIIGRIYNRKEEESVRQKYTRTLPWQKTDGETKQKKKK